MTLVTNLIGQTVTATGTFKSLLDGHTTTYTPPGVSSTAWGFFPGPETGETASQARARLETEVGQTAQVLRAYDSAGWTPGVQTAMTNYGMGNYDFVASFESNGTHSLTNIAAGTYDSDVNSLLSWISTNRGSHKIYLCFAHEFDLKVANSTYPFSGTGGFLPAQIHVYNLIKNHGDSNIIPTVIWSGFNFTGASGRFEPYWPSLAASCEQIGLDPYQNLQGSGSVLAPAVFNPLLDEINNFVGSSVPPIGIGEAGWRASSASTDVSPNPLAYVQSLSYLKGKVNWFCWFDNDSGSTKNNHLDSQTGCPAAYGTVMVS